MEGLPYNRDTKSLYFPDWRDQLPPEHQRRLREAEDFQHRALADIDRVLAYRPGYGGTGAVTEMATSYKACILRWAAPGSTHRKMAEAIDPFQTTKVSKLEQHVRALMATFRRDVEAGLVELVEQSPGGVETQRAGDTSMTTRIFISHSHADATIAKALVGLIESGLNVPEDSIRCTSLDGYKLEGGDPGPKTLRENLKTCNVVLVVLTKKSLASSFVLMELGAAWAFEKRAMPLVGPGADFGDFPGPFKDLHGLKMDHSPDMASVIDTVAKETSFGKKDNQSKIQAALRTLGEAVAASGASGVTPPAPFRTTT